jgi:hypothetical protein
MGARDRLLAWLVTGPLGRAYGLTAEITIALWRALTGQPQSEE